MTGTPFTELPRVPVRVGPSTPEGGLEPYMSGDFLMLGGRVPEKTSSPIGVTVDALLVLDALGDGTVFQVEVLLPRPRWRRARDAAPTPRSIPESGSVVLTDLGPNISVHRLTPRCTVHADARLHIELEPADAGARWIALSPGCVALLNGDFLAGFVAEATHG